MAVKETQTIARLGWRYGRANYVAKNRNIVIATPNSAYANYIDGNILALEAHCKVAESKLGLTQKQVKLAWKKLSDIEKRDTKLNPFS